MTAAQRRPPGSDRIAAERPSHCFAHYFSPGFNPGSVLDELGSCLAIVSPIAIDGDWSAMRVKRI